MEFMKNIGKGLNMIGSSFGVMTDVVDGVGASIKEGKDAVMEEITASKYEQKLENAKQAILSKHKAIVEISDKLGITFEEAEKLLDKVMGE